METQKKERMDGLVLIKEQNDFKMNTRQLTCTLRADGFEDVDIREYLAEVVNEAMKF